MARLAYGSRIMTDFLSRAERSTRMSAIRGRDNKTTERILAGMFRRHGVTGWRRHVPLPAKPDFVFPRQRVAVLVYGCFWHGCPVHYRPPTTCRAFWRNKLDANRRHDREVTSAPRRAGWQVLRIWEHALHTQRRSCSASQAPSPRPLRGVRIDRDVLACVSYAWASRTSWHHQGHGDGLRSVDDRQETLQEKQIQQNSRPPVAGHKWLAQRSGTLCCELVLL